MAKNSIFWHKKLRQIQLSQNLARQTLLTFIQAQQGCPCKNPAMVDFYFGFGATFYAKKCYFWPFSPTFSVPNFMKTQKLFKNGNINPFQKFWENWCRKSCKKWPKRAFLGPKTAIFGHFVMLASINWLRVVKNDIFE